MPRMLFQSGPGQSVSACSPRRIAASEMIWSSRSTADLVLRSARLGLGIYVPKELVDVVHAFEDVLKVGATSLKGKDGLSEGLSADGRSHPVW